MSYVETMVNWCCEEYLNSDNMEDFLDYAEDECDLTRKQLRIIIDECIEDYIKDNL